MIVYFSIYCFLGYVMESVYVSICQRHLISSGLLKGPFIPLYGFGACLLIMLTPYFKDSFWLVFLGGGMTMTLLEYLSSYYIEKVFETKCWDYSQHFCQFQGRICLFYFIIWCCLSDLFIVFIHPQISSLPIVNDTTCLISLIYLFFILKSLIDRFQFIKNNGLDIH